MIKERICSYELSMLLQEKGFDEECDYFYEHSTDEHSINEPQQLTFDELNYSYNLYIKAPTHQMACDWLREIYNICITIYPDKEKGFEAVLYDIEADVEITLQSFGIFGYHIFESSYEEAVESALKYCLKNLI